jgi:hypothetical protein
MTSLPRDSYLVAYGDDNEERFDVVQGLQGDIFDHYWDRYRDFRGMKWTRRKDESKDVELSTSGEEKEKVISGDMNIEMNLDAIKDIRKQYKKIKKYMRSSIYTVAMLDGREKIVSRLLKDQEDNPT